MVLGIPEVLTRWTFFPLQKTCGAPASVWLASSSSGCNKMQGECSNLRMGQSFEGCPPHSNDCRKCWESNTWENWLRRVVCQQGRNKCMGWCQFISIGSPVEEGQGYVGRCVLVAAHEQCQTHQPSWVRHCGERRQPGSTMAGKVVAPAHRLPMCLPLGVRHADWKSKNIHQGSKQDTDKAEVRHFKESSLRV